MLTQFVSPTGERSHVSGGNPLPVTQTAPVITELWSTGALVGPSGNAVSGWIDVGSRTTLRIGRATTAGNYAFEIDWSRDGVASDMTEVVAVGNNTTVGKDVAARYARFRVRNSDVALAFTAHRTNVFGR